MTRPRHDPLSAELATGQPFEQPTQQPTEQPSPQHADLDLLDTAALVQALADDQLGAVRAVQAAAPALAQAAELATERLRRGGRLVYLGAGTSGRLGVLDGVELLPTFSWPPERLVTLIAGGAGAMFRAVEGAEDDHAAGQRDLHSCNLAPDDVLIVLAASGTTPYALGAAEYARQRGTLCIALSNNPGSPLLALAEVPVLLDTGPEVISGSTRLKAGTAQKIALNTLSSAVMVRLNKVHGNLMVDLLATNHKLRRRALHLTVLASGARPPDAEQALAAAQGQVKTAIVMLRRALDAPAARRLLERSGGSVRGALAALDPDSR